MCDRCSARKEQYKRVVHKTKDLCYSFLWDQRMVRLNKNGKLEMGTNLMILRGPPQHLICSPAPQSFRSSGPPEATEETRLIGPRSVSGYRRNLINLKGNLLTSAQVSSFKLSTSLG